MTPVATLQETFQIAVLASDPAPGMFVREGHNEKGGFDLYINAYRVRLADALKDNYPVLYLALGDQLFDQLATAYIEQRPSRRRSIRWFGDGLREFIDKNPDLLPHPALADLASMDWALRGAFDAADAQVLHSAELAAIAPEHWPQLTFTLHPSVTLLDLGWPIEPIWHALSEAADAQTEEPESLTHTLLVWRQALECKWRSLGIAEAVALQAVARRDNFADICDALNTVKEGGTLGEPSALAASFLSQWLADGLLVSGEQLD